MLSDTSMAVAASGDRLEWTRFARVRGEWRAQESGRDGAPGMTGPLTLVVDHAYVMCRALVLPTTDPAEVPGMALLQLENQLPFVAEEMSVAVEVLSVDETNTTVLACAMPIAVLDAVAERLGLAR